MAKVSMALAELVEKGLKMTFSANCWDTSSPNDVSINSVRFLSDRER